MSRGEAGGGGARVGGEPHPHLEWDRAPSGLLTVRPDGTVVAANRTLLEWVGRRREEVVDRVRLSELLSVGGRIYWETHLSPLLLAAGRFDEVALELRTSQGRMPVLMSAVASRPDEPGPDVVHVAVSSARQRAQYERELRAARASAEAAAARVRALQQATAALSGGVGVGAVAAAVLSAAVGPLGAAAATLWVPGPGGSLEEYASSGEEPGTTARPTVDPRFPGAAAVRAGGRVIVPLRGQSALRGVLSLAEPEDPGSDPLDLHTLTAVGQQAGLALDRAHLHERDASVARRLQHALLAVPPHVDERIALATVYRPGVEMLEVGGDWHDVFLAEDDVLAIVVGDVVGRGLEAASAMGQLRSAVRAVAGPGVGPGRLLARLDRFVDQVEAASMATVAYAELDLGSGHLRYACAGHPPPLLLPADGEPRMLWDGRSTPLGGFLDPQRREAQVRLVPGDRLLLYTDGLVERHDRSLDEGLDLLTTTAAALRHAPLDDAVAALTRTMLQDEQVRDDVCVLLLAWSGG